MRGDRGGSTLMRILVSFERSCSPSMDYFFLSSPSSSKFLLFFFYIIFLGLINLKSVRLEVASRWLQTGDSLPSPLCGKGSK